MCVAALVALGGSSAFGGYLINFENDPTGAKPNGWQSADSSLVTFTDSLGADLQLANYGSQGSGKSLAINGDDPSMLIMNFSVLVNSLSLDFGNDDPGWSNAGDKAVLTLFNGATQVGQVSVVMNRNDIMDQTIIRFETGAVPEPAAIAAWLVLGLVGAGLIHRRRHGR
jgi:hypothetical protein